MKWLCIAAAIWLLGGCKEDALRTPVMAPTPPSETVQLAQVSAAVSQARKDNGKNPEGPPRQAVDLQLSVAQAGLPPTGAKEAASAAETSALVFAGKIEEATKRATTAELALADLRAQAARERAEGEARLKAFIAEAEQRVRAANAQAEHEAYLRVVSIFGIIGGAVVLLGIGCAVTGWSRIGVLGIPAGILIGGSGLLWGQPWFLWTVGGGVVLCAVAAGIFWAVRVYEARHPIKLSAAPAPAGPGTQSERPETG